MGLMESEKMPEKVYFARVGARDPGQNTLSKVNQLFHAAGFSSIISTGDLTAIKIHFGEWGNETYINPVHARQVVECIREAGGKPFLTDSNTLYRGSRANAVDHLITAIEHGFAYAVVKAPITIADGLRGNNWRRVEIHKNHFKSVLVSGDIADADALIAVSHFKGHEVAGFGGQSRILPWDAHPLQESKPSIVHGHCISMTGAPVVASALLHARERLSPLWRRRRANSHKFSTPGVSGVSSA